MKLSNILLFLIPAFIWGSTWYAIKFQLGVVDPLVSVGYRFFIASILLMAFCFISQKNMKYSKRDHFFMALQGLFLFGINYWFVYYAELSLTSGLVAVIFSLIVFLNIFFSAILLKMRVQPKVIIGAVLGVAGTTLIFNSEFQDVQLSGQQVTAIFFCLFSAIMASLGNIISAYNQKQHLPVIQTNAFGMLYGSVLVLLVAAFAGKEFSIEYSVSYLSSLFYLAIFGSVVAFSTYLKLIGNIGPSRAGYVIILVPVIALMFSSIFESYKITWYSMTGILFLIFGNYLAQKRKKTIPAATSK